MSTNCEVCGGNVFAGKSCYACGLRGPAGEGLEDHRAGLLLASLDLYDCKYAEPSQVQRDRARVALVFRDLVSEEKARADRAEQRVRELEAELEQSQRNKAYWELRYRDQFAGLEKL